MTALCGLLLTATESRGSIAARWTSTTRSEVSPATGAVALCSRTVKAASGSVLRMRAWRSFAMANSPCTVRRKGFPATTQGTYCRRRTAQCGSGRTTRAWIVCCRTAGWRCGVPNRDYRIRQSIPCSRPATATSGSATGGALSLAFTRDTSLSSTIRTRANFPSTRCSRTGMERYGSDSRARGWHASIMERFATSPTVAESPR
jgi:hypothetical protein